MFSVPISLTDPHRVIRNVSVRVFNSSYLSTPGNGRRLRAYSSGALPGRPHIMASTKSLYLLNFISSVEWRILVHSARSLVISVLLRPSFTAISGGPCSILSLGTILTSIGFLNTAPSSFISFSMVILLLRKPKTIKHVSLQL